MGSPESTGGPANAVADAPRAAILLVGNELLSGKIRDDNGHFLTRALRRHGIRVVEISVVPDEVAAIADATLRLLRAAPLLFTSGGVGPTHDDVTLPAIAAATDCPLEVHPELLALLRDHYGADAPAEALAMARTPRGTRLRALPGWPVLRLDPDAERLRLLDGARVYMLPGIPGLFRAKIRALEALAGELPAAAPWSLYTLRTTVDESALAGALAEVASQHPEAEIGSYPRWIEDGEGQRQMEVELTFESTRDATASAARDAMARLLDAGRPLA